MSKYRLLWEYVNKKDCPSAKLSFGEIEEISGSGLDHSFLKHKRELLPLGYKVAKISLKEQWVLFSKID